MSLAILMLGLAAFLGAHVFVTMRASRAAVIARLGERPYKGLMALVSIVGVALVSYGFARYRAGGWIELWRPPGWTHYVTQVLMWPASICIVAADAPRTLRPSSALKRAIKRCTNVGKSSLRSRSGGASIGNTFKR